MMTRKVVKVNWSGLPFCFSFSLGLFHFWFCYFAFCFVGTAMSVNGNVGPGGFSNLCSVNKNKI